VNVAADNTSTLSMSVPSPDCSGGHSTPLAHLTQSVATRGHPQALYERACGRQCRPFLTRPDFVSDTTVTLVKAAASPHTGARRRGRRLRTRPARRGEVLILCLSALLWSVVTAAADTATEIRALEVAHNQALANHDVATLEKMLSEDFTFVTPRGDLRGKQDVLKAVATGNIGNEYLETSDLKIRVYADTAVVTGRALQTAQRAGKDFTDSYRFTRVYVRRGGQWLAVALQMTRLDGF
jgi:ketosteroid isomerase-like protein